MKLRLRGSVFEGTLFSRRWLPLAGSFERIKVEVEELERDYKELLRKPMQRRQRRMPFVLTF